MPPIDDEEFDRLLREAAPRAPGGFAARVMAGVASRSRARRRALLGGAAMGVLAAAALLLMMRARPREALPPADGWRVARVEGAVRVPAGRVLTDGAELVVPAGGRAELERGGARFAITPRPGGGAARVRVDRGALVLDDGAGELAGDGARATTTPARVIAIGDDARISLELTRRRSMSAPLKTVGTVAALGAAVLSVYVLRGRARVEASAPGGGVALLGRGDRALVADGTPPLALRTAPPPPTVAARRAPDEAANATALGANPSENAGARRQHLGAGDDRPAGGEPRGVLDKEEIRATMVTILPKIRGCYERALESNPALAGRVTIEMKIRARDGKGKVDEADVLYDESSQDDLDSPATEHCLLEQIAAADFPAPRGDGEVLVRYPFILKSAADE